MRGTLYEAKSDTIVIASHGYRSSQYSGLVMGMCETLNEKGMAAYAMDYPEKLSEKRWRQGTMESMTSELKEAIQEFRKKYKKIIIMGSSLGATVSLQVASEVEVEGLIDYAGPTKWELKSKFSEEELKKFKKEGEIESYREDIDVTFVIPWQLAEEAEKSDVLSSAKNIKCPVLIIQGTKDESVPPEQSQELFETLKYKKDIFIIGGGEHRLTPEHKAEAIDMILEWTKRLVNNNKN
ncbi:prolyl oligopeptidase family serine peptidase [Candidatus Woesearchaeota archaeon]|nr:prolyl oligopeptidase family serine peptidase [Candidatus Woesearchaeota archaeon]